MIAAAQCAAVAAAAAAAVAVAAAHPPRINPISTFYVPTFCHLGEIVFGPKLETRKNNFDLKTVNFAKSTNALKPNSIPFRILILMKRFQW